MKGIYTLVIKLDETQRIKVGSLGNLKFSKGFYVYVGSAQNGLEARIGRHLSDDKKTHWHIDYLLDRAEIVRVFVSDGDKNEECRIAKYLSTSMDKIDDFGSSDCNCPSHLFYSDSFDQVIDIIKEYTGLKEYNLE